MNDRHGADHRHAPTGGFWRSRSGILLLAFLGFGGLLLAYEHRVHLAAGDGLLALLLLACIGIHLFLHGGHGGHGSDRGGT